MTTHNTPARRRTRLGRLVAVAAALALAVSGCSAASGTDASDASDTVEKTSTEIVDILGRTVTVQLPVSRALLESQVFLNGMGILEPENPVEHIAGWPGNTVGNPDPFDDIGTYNQFAAAFPAVDDVPSTGNFFHGSFSSEEVVGLRPDVYLATPSGFESATSAGIVDTLAKAGVPTVVLDYESKTLDTLPDSITIQGTLFGQEDRASAFVDFYDRKMELLSSHLEKVSGDPASVFLWQAPGLFDCCTTYVQTRMDHLVTHAGGVNIGKGLVANETALMSVEAVIAENPDVIIETGGQWQDPDSAVHLGVHLGYTADAAEAGEQALEQISAVPGFDQLPAVAEGRTEALWNTFGTTPYDYTAILWLAKTMYPEAFADVDPEAELQEYFDTFMPVPLTGSFWTTTGPDA